MKYKQVIKQNRSRMRRNEERSSRQVHSSTSSNNKISAFMYGLFINNNVWYFVISVSHKIW